MLMGLSGSRTTAPLVLENLARNPALARRLPPALAWRYHALPVAEDNGCITVAMADPDDAAAREAVETALGMTTYMVRGDPAAIDALLAEVWPQEEDCSLRLLVCTQGSPVADEVWAYAQRLGDLLSAHVSLFETVAGGGALFQALANEVERAGYDLVILGEPHPSLVERLLSGPVGRGVADRVPTSLLVTQRPGWPLRRILLVMRGEERDDVAVDWIVRLAQPSSATVTVLAVVPPLPAMYRDVARMEQGLAALLATDTALGRQMRRVARRLVNSEIEGTLQLRQGPPDWQIRREVAEGDYDLIAIAAEDHGRWLRRLLGEVVGSLLRWADRPVLIAKPTTA